MSALPYEMASTWQDQHVAPQLEQEYALDHTMFSSFPNSIIPPQSMQRRQGASANPSSIGQSPPFATFNPSLPQQSFNFTMPSAVQDQSQNATHNGQQGYFPSMAGSSPSPAAPVPHFPQQNGMYAGPSSSVHRGQMNGFQDQSVFPQYAQQNVNMGSSPSHAGPFEPGPSQGFNSPPQAYPQTFPGEMGMADQTMPQHSAMYIGNANGYEGSIGGPSVKRHRPADDGNGPWDFDPDELDDREAGPEQEVKAKPLGACERCKGLKVKCEFKNGADVCKRCSNGNHKCQIPGRKKRKAPPKRETLLSEIAQQADKINKLMAQLEAAQRKINEAQEARLSAYSAPSPGQSVTTDSFSLISSITSPESEARDASEVARTNADVHDWIVKARESINAFGGYISMGGPSATREMLAGEDEGSDRDLTTSEPDDDIEIGVERAEGDETVDYSGDEGSVDTSRKSNTETKKTRLAIIPNEASPFGLMANLHLGNQNLRKMRSKSSMGGDEEAKEDLGLANADYFRPSPTIERPIIEDHQTPHILRLGLVTPVEVEKLFGIYWDYMNLSVSLLDPALYSAKQTYWRSPFLFTVICGIASRFYTDRPGLYQQAMHYARLAAGTALIGGQKNVESVHAYILLSLYPVPVRKWEDDRSWIYLGVAIRIATDLNLHHPNTAKPKDEMHAREMLNRTRAWLNCFNLDRSTGSQYGKSPIISNADYTANHSAQWWNSSPHNMKGFDIQLSCYNAELTIVGKFRAKIHSDPNSPTGFNKNLDLATLASETDDDLGRLWLHWLGLLREHTDPNDIKSNFRTGLLRLAYSYARMSVLSFGFQAAFGKTSVGQDVTLLWRCLRAAFDVLNAVLEDIAVPDQKIFLRHGPEAQSVFVTFACAFLLKLMQPRYASYVSREHRLEIRDKVEKIADLLGSPEVAIDDHHGPKLYSAFLKSLLAAPVARVDRPPMSKRALAKAKSVSPTIQKSDLHEENKRAKAASTPVTPAALRQSVSPEPENGMPAVSSPGTFGTTVTESETLNGLGMDMNMSEFFNPPLPFESELLQSMTDPSMWPDMAIPGFGWMGSYQQGSSDNMN